MGLFQAGRTSVAVVMNIITFLGGVALYTTAAFAQKTEPPATPAETVVAPAPLATAPVVAAPVVMLSDLHFDPFYDPGKFKRLRSEPISAWRGILSTPDSHTQAAGSVSLTAACKTRGSDSPWTLIESSLAAAHEQSPHALFVTVSGDLLVHGFDCRFKALTHGAAQAESSKFAAKTVAFLESEFHRTFERTPVYVALGNNDSGCGDYKEDPGSDFLQSVAESFGEVLEAPADRKDWMHAFAANGNYSIEMPKPIAHGRLIILQNLFLSRMYTRCNGKPDATQGAAQLQWLRSELAAAHAKHEQVWVMAHIPPGVDLYSTFTRSRDVCAGQPPEMFLRDEKLVEVLTDFAADIRLAIFGHTHMDEMRLLQGRTLPEKGTASPASAKPPWVAAKLVPSISPINGNYPAFILADVNSQTASLRDYRVVAADNKSGVAANWKESYRYSTTYHSSGFTPENLAVILTVFKGDKESASPQSEAYEKNFFVGGGLRAMAIRLVWPAYVCSIENNTAAGYRACLCPAKP